MDALTFEKHYPSHNNGILGCDGFSDTDTIFCLVANGDNNFLNFGIVNDTILFVDKSKEFKEDREIVSSLYFVHICKQRQIVCILVSR